MLQGLIARIEERMVRDGVRSGEQMKRDGEQMIRHGERKGRSGKETTKWGEEMRDAGMQKIEDDKKKGLDGRGARGWYVECADPTLHGMLLGAGFWELDVQCAQPPAHLLYKPFGRAYEPPTINKQAFLQTVKEIGELAHGEPTPDVAKLEKLLQGHSTVKVKPKPPVGKS
jgi:hypothetical protein